MYAFSFTAENALLFFELCKELKLDTEEQRMNLIEAMAKQGKIQSITKTPMSKEDYVKHLSKNFKVLQIKGEE